jgi:glycosyltransferase involved in cell wall biosynthesis
VNTHSAAATISSGDIYVSIGIIAWNEEQALRPLFKSVFTQTFFAGLRRRQLKCEIVLMANGCSDRTPELAEQIFAEAARTNPYAEAFVARVVNLQERGKINAWNVFVHNSSAREAQFLFLADADIVIHNPETLWNMLLTLETNAEASVSVDRPSKDIEFKEQKSFRERMSLRMSRLTLSSSAQLCAQLYCIRSAIARNIYLPKDLTACDDGFIKSLVCTDFLAHDVWSMRIQVARNAAHTFEAYTSLKSIFKNQKRQAIGQTLVHILIDEHLKQLPPWDRTKLADTLRKKEQENPNWLKELIGKHLRRTKHFWRLYPGFLTHRFRHFKRLNWFGKMMCLPVALAGSLFAIPAGFAAFRFLKSGCTNYWPQADRGSFKHFELRGGTIAPLGSLKTHQE